MKASLGHVGLGVSDIERSIAFYRDVLGMRVIRQLEIDDDRIGRVIGTAGARCRIAHLESSCGILELFQYTHPQGKTVAPSMRQYDIGLIHIGFEVDGFHDWLEKLKQNNVPLLGEPVEFRPGVWVAYFQGPDGEVCEFREQPK